MNLIKRSFTLGGHQTSIALEPEFWDALLKIANNNAQTLSNLIMLIDGLRGERPLASSIRVYCLKNLI